MTYFYIYLLHLQLLPFSESFAFIFCSLFFIEQDLFLSGETLILKFFAFSFQHLSSQKKLLFSLKISLNREYWMRLILSYLFLLTLFIDLIHRAHSKDELEAFPLLGVELSLFLQLVVLFFCLDECVFRFLRSHIFISLLYTSVLVHFKTDCVQIKL